MLVIVIVFVLLGSTFGAVINSFGKNSNESENLVKFNDNEFNYQNGFWILEKFGGTFAFLNTPYETSGILEVNNLTKTIEDYSEATVYIYSEDSGSEVEIYRNLYLWVERIQNACPEGVKCTNENLPTKNCDNNMIIIQESEKNEIIQEDNCVYINGNKENLIKNSDEFMFSLLGVKND